MSDQDRFYVTGWIVKHWDKAFLLDTKEYGQQWVPYRHSDIPLPLDDEGLVSVGVTPWLARVKGWTPKQKNRPSAESYACGHDYGRPDPDNHMPHSYTAQAGMDAPEDGERYHSNWYPYDGLSA